MSGLVLRVSVQSSAPLCFYVVFPWRWALRPRRGVFLCVVCLRGFTDQGIEASRARRLGSASEWSRSPRKWSRLRFVVFFRVVFPWCGACHPHSGVLTLWFSDVVLDVV